MESNEPVAFSTLPIVEDVQGSKTAVDDGDYVVSEDIGDEMAIDEPMQEKVDPAAAVYAIPELAALGRAFRSCAAVPLTETETEYVVTCIKHIFDGHVVLQFNVQNTIDDQRLENVSVMLENENGLYEVAGEIPVETIKYGETASCFTLLQRNDDETSETSEFNCTLHFNVVQVDPTTGEDESDAFEEEYPLEDLEVSTADYMAKVTAPDFRKAWEAVGSTNEILEKYALQFKNLEDAVASVINLLGMQPVDGTGNINANTGNKPHMLHLSGVFLGGHQTYARAQLGMQGDSGVVLKIAVRSDNESVPRMVADCIS